MVGLIEKTEKVMRANKNHGALCSCVECAKTLAASGIVLQPESGVESNPFAQILLAGLGQ